MLRLFLTLKIIELSIWFYYSLRTPLGSQQEYKSKLLAYVYEFYETKVQQGEQKGKPL